MKKIFVFFAVLICLGLFISLVSSVDKLDDLKESADEKIEKVEEVKDVISDKSTRAEYLEQEWEKIIEKSWLKKPLGIVEKFFSYANPFWKIVLGTGFSFSWVFILTFMFWILFLIIAFRVFSLFEPLIKSVEYAGYYKWGAFAVFFIFISSIRIPMGVADFILSFISKSDSIVFQLFSAIFIFMLIIFSIVFSKNIKQLSRFFKREKEIQGLKDSKEIQKEKLENIEKEMKKVKEKEEKEEEDKAIKESARKELKGLSQE